MTVMHTKAYACLRVLHDGHPQVLVQLHCLVAVLSKRRIHEDDWHDGFDR